MAFLMLSMDFDTSGQSNSYFRILANTIVKYVIIAPGTMDAESLDDMPLNFMNLLPPLPYDDSSWTTAHIFRSASGELLSSLSRSQLKGVTALWHPSMIDFRQLERIESLAPLTQECKWLSRVPPDDSNITMIAKMARFEWEIPYIQRETEIYSLLEGTEIAPQFLGHIHEQGRIIGILLEKVNGRPAGIEDLQICSSALNRLHGLGISHGDCNRYNFIVGVDAKVTLVDFEKSTVGASEDSMQVETANLHKELVEVTGRGGGFVPLLDDETQADLTGNTLNNCLDTL
jgi:predicted Ser/Thr protein kinase